jgi:hypothetical protein
MVAVWRTAATAMAFFWLVAGCSKESAVAPESLTEPPLPAGESGAVLDRAIEAAGGWGRWQKVRDISFISTLTIVDPSRRVSTERLGWFKAPLHKGALARMDSIGLPSEVQFGIDGGHTWILRDGKSVEDPNQLSLTRFDMVSNLFWFSLPFLLAEMPATITDLGEQLGDVGQRWRLLKVVFDTPNPVVPGKWFVLYFDTATWRIDRVHAHLTAPFLRQEIWIGEWLDYKQYGGLWVERERRFYPANTGGEIIGQMVAQQLVEHVRLDEGGSEESFRHPPENTRPISKQDPPGSGDRRPKMIEPGPPVRFELEVAPPRSGV